MQTIESRKEKLAALKTKIADFAIWEDSFRKRLISIDKDIKEMKEQVKHIAIQVEDLKHEAK